MYAHALPWPLTLRICRLSAGLRRPVRRRGIDAWSTQCAVRGADARRSAFAFSAKSRAADRLRCARPGARPRRRDPSLPPPRRARRAAPARLPVHGLARSPACLRGLLRALAAQAVVRRTFRTGGDYGSPIAQRLRAATTWHDVSTRATPRQPLASARRVDVRSTFRLCGGRPRSFDATAPCGSWSLSAPTGAPWLHVIADLLCAQAIAPHFSERVAGAALLPPSDKPHVRFRGTTRAMRLPKASRLAASTATRSSTARTALAGARGAPSACWAAVLPALGPAPVR